MLTTNSKDYMLRKTEYSTDSVSWKVANAFITMVTTNKLSIVCFNENEWCFMWH